jgi:hypothetical protein
MRRQWILRRRRSRVGLLGRRPVSAGVAILIGKASSRIGGSSHPTRDLLGLMESRRLIQPPVVRTIIKRAIGTEDSADDAFARVIEVFGITATEQRNFAQQLTQQFRPCASQGVGLRLDLSELTVVDPVQQDMLQHKGIDGDLAEGAFNPKVARSRLARPTRTGPPDQGPPDQRRTIRSDLRRHSTTVISPRRIRRASSTTHTVGFGGSPPANPPSPPGVPGQ